MTKLANLLTLLEKNVSHYETLNQKVSEANVGWHIEHSLLTLNRITNFLISSNPNDYQWNFNFIRIVLMATKKIPRGKGKAPEVVLPKGNINQDSLLTHILLT
jgi:hypothetical protein